MHFIILIDHIRYDQNIDYNKFHCSIWKSFFIILNLIVDHPTKILPGKRFIKLNLDSISSFSHRMVSFWLLSFTRRMDKKYLNCILQSLKWWIHRSVHFLFIIPHHLSILFNKKKLKFRSQVTDLIFIVCQLI